LPSTGSTGVETCNGTGRSSSCSVSVFMANTLFVSGEKELVISDYSLEALFNFLSTVHRSNLISPKI
jgi:hypothetical protein